MQRRGNAPAATNELIGGKAIDRHDRSAAEQTSELDHVADLATWHGNNADCSRLVIHHADSHLISDDRCDGLGRSRTWYRHHVDTDGADTGPRFQFFQTECAHARSLDHAGVFLDRIEGAAMTPASRACPRGLLFLEARAHGS